MKLNCAACGVVEDVATFTNKGWICRRCQLSATSITKVYVIAGIEYEEQLKGSPATITEAVAASAIPFARTKGTAR